MTFDPGMFTVQRRIFQAADDAWSAELTRVYGKNAGDARYDQRGRATPELLRLASVRDAEMQRYHAAEDSRRRALRAVSGCHYRDARTAQRCGAAHTLAEHAEELA